MSKLYPLLFLCLMLAPFQWGRAQSLRKWVEAADKAYQKQDFYTAFKLYEIALEYDSNRIDLWYQYAQSAREFNAFPASAEAYGRVLRHADSTHYPQTSYWLATVKQRQGRYSEAAGLYERFIQGYASREPALLENARLQQEACREALRQLEEKPDDIQPVTHLDSTINTPYSEIAPAPRGDTLYYSSFRFPYKKDKDDRLFIKVLLAGRDPSGPDLFYTGQVLGEDFNRKGKHTANTAFSEDGGVMYFTICDYVDLGKVRCDLYLRKRNASGIWNEPVKLNINIDSCTSTQPALGYDRRSGRQLLFFSSDRPGGAGGMDIWYSELDAGGLPSAPLNLRAINTPGDEVTPFYHNRSEQLFFSTDGFSGWGGLDVYRSKPDSAGAWGFPQILSRDVNSSYNDIYYSLNPRGDKAYFSSDRLGSAFIEADKEACCYDIYAADIDLNVILLAQTFDKLDLTQLTGATVYLYEIAADGGKILVDSISKENDFQYHFPLERYKKYQVEARKDGYSQDLQLIDLTDVDFVQSDTIVRELYLEPQTIDLQVLTFDLLTEAPLDSSTVRLQELVNGTPRLLSAKTNPIGNDFLFPLYLNKTYIITAERREYFPRADTVRFTAQDIARLGPRVIVELYLEKPGTGGLPLALYFDNDAPDRRSYSTTTKKTYGETYEQYYAKKNEYIKRFTEGLSQEDSFLVARRYDDFFDREVRGGYLALEAFSVNLQSFLEAGNSVQIKLKGYASPRASSKYNLILSKRRIQSVRNHFAHYNNGALQKYLSSGRLRVEEEAFGESTASQEVSDRINDEKNSIYSLLASVERRVEIVDVSTEEQSAVPLTTRNRK